MNYPFKFSFTATNQHGVIWNPSGYTVGSSIDNTGDPANGTLATEASLNAVTGKIWITGLSIQVDGSGGGKCTLGYFDPAGGGNFRPLYTVLATDVAGGGLIRDFDTGFLIPAGTVPCFRHDGSGAAVIAGDVRVFNVK